MIIVFGNMCASSLKREASKTIRVMLGLYWQNGTEMEITIQALGIKGFHKSGVPFWGVPPKI